MVKRSCCLYNNQLIRIEEFYTICDGKQINIPDKIEKFRELGKKNELKCPCGCDLKLEIVAGEKMLRKQHFREKKGQDKTYFNCRETFESEITANSRIILKCWLDDIFHLKQGEMRFNVPINQVYDVERKYEYTHYVDSKKFGLSYERLSSNWNLGKIELLLSQSQERMLHIMDISNAGCEGQYPEYKMRVQKLQGFCALLDTHNNYNYYEADFKVSIYEKDYRGLWKELLISKGKLSQYHFDEKYNLICREQNISEKVKETKERFEKEQDILKSAEEEKAARIREKRKKEQEEAKQKREEEKRVAEEERRLQEERKERMRKEQEEQLKRRREEQKRISLEFVQMNPKLNHFYNYLCSIESIEGSFSSVQADGKIKERKEKITIVDIDYNTKLNRFEIQDKDLVKYYIYVDDSYSRMKSSFVSNSYTYIPLKRLEIERIIPFFRSYFYCEKKKELIPELHGGGDKSDDSKIMKTEVIYCELGEGCSYLNDNNICGYPKSKCNYRIFK